MRSEEQLIEICELIRSGRRGKHPVELPPEDFKTLYEILVKTNDRKLPEVVAVNLGDQAYFMFPEWSPQEVLIHAKKQIAREDFSYISILDWRGAQKRTPGFLKFIIWEFVSHKLRTAVVAGMAFAVMLLIGPTGRALNLLNTLLCPRPIYLTAIKPVSAE